MIQILACALLVAVSANNCDKPAVRRSVGVEYPYRRSANFPAGDENVEPLHPAIEDVIQKAMKFITENIAPILPPDDSQVNTETQRNIFYGSIDYPENQPNMEPPEDNDLAENDAHPETPVGNYQTSRTFGFFAGLARPLSGFLGHHYGDTQVNGELTGLENSRLELQSALRLKEQQNRKKNEAEIHQLKMELESLKKQWESTIAAEERESAKRMYEYKLEKFRQEMMEKRHREELQHSASQQKLQQSAYEQQLQQLNHIRNQNLVDKTVYQPIVEYRTPIIKGSLNGNLGSTYLPDASSYLSDTSEARDQSLNYKYESNWQANSNQESSSYWSSDYNV